MSLWKCSVNSLLLFTGHATVQRQTENDTNDNKTCLKRKRKKREKKRRSNNNQIKTVKISFKSLEKLASESVIPDTDGNAWNRGQCKLCWQLDNQINQNWLWGEV